MKIAIATDLYAPMINGVAVFSHNLAAGLMSRGHEVLVLAPSLDGEDRVRMEDGVRVARLSSFRVPFYPDQIAKVPEARKILGYKVPNILYKNGIHMSLMPYGEIKRVLDEFAPDVIHEQTPMSVGLAVFAYAKRRGVPIVATGHAYPDNATGQMVKFMKPVKKPIDAAVRTYFASFLRRADYATMPTKVAIAELMPDGRGRGKSKVEALSNGIDLSKFRHLPAPAEFYAKYGIPKDRLIVGYVGRVDPEKSLRVLVKAFSRVVAKIPEAFLVVVGDGTDRVRLEKMVAELGIGESVKFLGRITGDDLPMVYRTFDVFGLTSETETQSIVLMEAMATGLPAVAVRAGAIGELVKTGRNGFLCRPRDVAGVARGLMKLLENSEMRDKYGKESLEIVKKHDIKHTLDRLEEIYAKVAKR